MPRGVVDIFGNAVALFQERRFLQLIVGAQKFVFALFQFLHALFDEFVLSVYRHGETEHDKVQDEYNEVGKILRRRGERRFQRIADERHHRVFDGINADVHGKHDDIVAQRGAGQVIFGENERVHEIEVRSRGLRRFAPGGEQRQKHQQNGVEHVKGNFFVEIAHEQCLDRHDDDEYDRGRQRQKKERAVHVRKRHRDARDDEQDQNNEL